MHVVSPIFPSVDTSSFREVWGHAVHHFCAIQSYYDQILLRAFQFIRRRGRLPRLLSCLEPQLSVIVTPLSLTEPQTHREVNYTVFLSFKHSSIRGRMKYFLSRYTQHYWNRALNKSSTFLFFFFPFFFLFSSAVLYPPGRNWKHISWTTRVFVEMLSRPSFVLLQRRDSDTSRTSWILAQSVSSCVLHLGLILGANLGLKFRFSWLKAWVILFLWICSAGLS